MQCLAFVRLVRLIVYDCVTFVVEAGGRLRQLWIGFGIRRLCRGDCAPICARGFVQRVATLHPRMD